MKVVRALYKSKPSWAYINKDTLALLSDAPWLGGKLTGEKISYDIKELLAPCLPGKILAVAVNYPGVTGLDTSIKEPLTFIKTPNCVVGPNEAIINPFNDFATWGECELAVVIGKRLCKASAEEAKSAVFGYTIANDVTVENSGKRDHHLARSKAIDTFCPVGPWIETEYQPGEQVIEGLHNNILLRQGRINERLHKEPALLVWLSSWITLEPGDLILTGAPTRVRERIFFQDGDTYTCRIEGLGFLKTSYSAGNKDETNYSF